jgi:hypothetical protein
MGFRIALYSRTLFSRDSCERLPISQFICLVFNVSCWRFIFMCAFHVSLRSKWSPMYFTSDLVVMMELLIVTCGQLIWHVVKVICTDLSLLIFVRHFWNHRCSRFMCLYKSAEAIRGSRFAERITVSSANVVRTVLSVVGRSDVYNR